NSSRHMRTYSTSCCRCLGILHCRTHFTLHGLSHAVSESLKNLVPETSEIRHVLVDVNKTAFSEVPGINTVHKTLAVSSHRRSIHNVLTVAQTGRDTI